MSKLPLPALAVPVGIAAALVALAPAPAAAEATRLSDFAGAWTRIAIDEDESHRIAAIRASIAGLSWITQQFARPILESTTEPPVGYDFAVDGGELRMAPRGEPLRTLPLNGSRDAADGPRGRFTRTARVVDGAIETHWEQSEATGRNVYRVDRDGTLVVDHTIHVTGLEGVETIQYRSRFRRAPDVASPAR